MRSKISRLVERDFLELDQHVFEPFRKKAVVVTGATGFVGSLVARYLLLANEHYGLGARIVAVVRSKEKARAILGPYDLCASVAYHACDFMFEDSLNSIEVCDYILHAAAITTSRVMVERPADVIETSLSGTRATLKLARSTGARMAYVSSMEVYGTTGGSGKSAEDVLGIVDLASVRSCYPESKRLCECLCLAYAHQHGVEVCSARLAQTLGVGVLPSENRVFAQFARAALTGESIVLKTTGRSEGNYVYASDAVAALLMLLAQGEPGEPYNVANEACHTTIYEMAQLVSRTLSRGASRIIIEPDESNAAGYAPDVQLFLDSGKLRALGWRPKVGLAEAYRRLGAYLVEG